MNKNDYLDQEIVAHFVSYLAELINGEEVLGFAYHFLPQHAPADFDQIFGLTGTAQTLEDLFNRYWWDGQYYDANANALAGFQKAIRIAFKSPTIKPSEVRSAVEKIMEWGLMPNAAAKNMAWADLQGKDFPGLLLEGKKALESESPNFGIFPRVRMNAGYTKVFSLLCDGIIIYDGRVGAALCWLVRQFLNKAVHSGPVPQALAFRWAKGTGQNPQNRNPAGDGFKFSQLARDEKLWARANVHASWILEATRLKSDARWCSGEEGLRKVEAAFFMLGYALPLESAICAAKSSSVRAPRNRAQVTESLLKNQISFQYGGGYFEIQDLVEYVESSDRDYVIGGGCNQGLSLHKKPESLDYWLRKRSNQPNIRQVTQKLIQDIIETDYFTYEENLPCPTTGRRCNGLRLATNFFRQGQVDAQTSD